MIGGIVETFRSLWRQASLVRIALAAVVTAAVCDRFIAPWVAVVPQILSGTEEAGSLMVGDPRVVRRDRRRTGNEFWTIWVTDSSPIILSQYKPGEKLRSVGLVQSMVQAKLPTINGRPHRITMFATGRGPKALDKYFVTQYALSLKPDLVIYTINPTFDFDSWRILQLNDTPGQFAPFSSAGAWRFIAAYASPAEIVHGYMASRMSSIENRIAFSEKMAQMRAQMDVFGLSRVKVPPARPVSVWSTEKMLYFRAAYERLPRRLGPPGPGTQQPQLVSLALSEGSKGGVGWNIIENLVGDVRSSGVPAIIYMLPANFAVIATVPKASRNMDAIEATLKELSAVHSGPRLRIVESSPARFLDGLSYYDVSHLTKAEPFVDFMVKEIEAMAKNAN